MHVLDIENGITGYRQLVKFVRDRGERRNPRGIPTRDVGPVAVVMHDINWSLPLHIGRKVNKKIGAAEAVQLIGAFSDPALLDYASPNFKQFAEPDGRYWGAYGRRIKDQLSHVVHKLRLDVDTRQAIITLWDPFMDNQAGKKDYPCTVMLHFALIDARLEMVVTMRSQDVWWGTPYDWFQFTQLQHTVAQLLSVQTGLYRHITLSTHLYERNVSEVDQLLDPPPMAEWEWQPRGIGYPHDSVQRMQYRAQRLVTQNIDQMTKSELWYREQFKTYVG